MLRMDEKYYYCYISLRDNNYCKPRLPLPGNVVMLMFGINTFGSKLKSSVVHYIGSKPNYSYFIIHILRGAENTTITKGVATTGNRCTVQSATEGNQVATEVATKPQPP